MENKGKLILAINKQVILTFIVEQIVAWLLLMQRIRVHYGEIMGESKTNICGNVGHQLLVI